VGLQKALLDTLRSQMISQGQEDFGYAKLFGFTAVSRAWQKGNAGMRVGHQHKEPPHFIISRITPANVSASS
jgi:hypothetical protein